MVKPDQLENPPWPRLLDLWVQTAVRRAPNPHHCQPPQTRGMLRRLGCTRCREGRGVPGNYLGARPVAFTRYIEYGVIERAGHALFGTCSVRSLLWHWLTGNYDEATAAMFVFDSDGRKYRARYDGQAPFGSRREIDVWTLTTGTGAIRGYVDANGWFYAIEPLPTAETAGPGGDPQPD